MKPEEFINKNASPYEFWDGYEGRLIAKQDALEALDLATNEILDVSMEIVMKHVIPGHSVVSPVIESILNKLKELKK